MKFDYIQNKRFKSILERDYQEMLNCLDCNAPKAVLILCGSIMEAVVADYLIEIAPSETKKNSILKLSLGDLLESAEKAKLISNKDRQIGIIIKEYRNLIHPGRELRTKEEFDINSANISKSLLDIILKKVNKHHQNNYGYSSNEIIEKLKNDYDFHTIFGSVITKLDHNERERLLSKLIEIETLYKRCYEYYSFDLDIDPKEKIKALKNLEYIKPLVAELKPLVQNETILSHLRLLKDSVIKGESVSALSLYNLFHEELYQLDKTDQEIIAIYMLKLYISLLENSHELAYEKTFSTIGKYLYTDKSFERLKEFSMDCFANFGGKETIQHEINVFQQIFNSLSQEFQSQIQEYFPKILPPNRSQLTHDWEYFYIEMVKRKIIKEIYGS